VQITVTRQGISDTKSRTYTPPCAPAGIPISPVADQDTQIVAIPFWVDVKVGSPSNPVTDLFGVSFVLSWTQGDYIDVDTPYNSTVVPGSFLGTDIVFYQTVDEPASKLSAAISRKAGAGGVSGNGTILRVQFVAKTNAPCSFDVQFSISEVLATDPSGNSINLAPQLEIVHIMCGMPVWPGDTNNDGLVNQADILPIGLYWNSTGQVSATPPSCKWAPRYCPPWSPAAATYSDANGDGIVNQADVLCIGLNWGKTHTTTFDLISARPLEKAHRPQAPLVVPALESSVCAPGQEFTIRVDAPLVTDLFGLALKLSYDRDDILEIVAVEPGTIFGPDALLYYNVQDTARNVAVGISRKAGLERGNGTGSALFVKAKIKRNAPVGETVNFWLEGIVANDASGAPLEVAAQSEVTTVTVATSVESEENTSQPVDFRLHQNHPNPFNAGTTISYEIPEDVHVTIKVYSSTGQYITTLVNKFTQRGRYRINWDGRDEHGQAVASGVYIYQIEAGSFTQNRKMILLR